MDACLDLNRQIKKKLCPAEDVAQDLMASQRKSLGGSSSIRWGPDDFLVEFPKNNILFDSETVSPWINIIPAVISHHCPRSPSSKVTQKSRVVLPAILRLVVGPLEPHFWIAMHRYVCVSEDYGKLLKSAGEPSFPTKKNINWGQKLSNFQTIRWLSRTPDIEIEILRVSADQDRFISIALLIYVHSHIIH